VSHAPQRARTFYALTDRRALIVVVERGTRIASIDLTKRREVQVTYGKRGDGTIAFESHRRLRRVAD
jgi:hypothetical protein